MITPSPAFKLSMIDNLMFNLTKDLIGLYLEKKDWSQVRTIALEHNLPQKNTLSSRKRYLVEALARLRYLTGDEMEYLNSEASTAEQKLLLWIALSRSNHLVREFALKLLRENFLNLKPQVTLADFDAFFCDLSADHEELLQLSVAMKNKLRGRVICTAKEAGLLSSENLIERIFVSARFCATVAANSPSDLLYLPLSDDTLKRLL